VPGIHQSADSPGRCFIRGEDANLEYTSNGEKRVSAGLTHGKGYTVMDILLEFLLQHSAAGVLRSFKDRRAGVTDITAKRAKVRRNVEACKSAVRAGKTYVIAQVL
jgi:hypothetical protein